MHTQHTYYTYTISHIILSVTYTGILYTIDYIKLFSNTYSQKMYKHHYEINIKSIKNINFLLWLAHH